MRETEIIIAVVTKVIYCKQDSDWYILKTDRGTAKGVVLFEPKENEMLQLEGYWQTSKFDGNEEFVFKVALLSIPDDPKALLHYAVELTKGMGEAAEDKIWEAYGDQWLKEKELEGVLGLTRQARVNWQETLDFLKDHVAQRQAIAFLLSKSCTLNMATGAWKRWREKTISLVSDDCYRLTELPNHGFTSVDAEIRKHFGIKDGDPRRLDAALLYVLIQLTEQNGTLIEAEDAAKELSRIVPDVADRMSDSITRLIQAKKVAALNSNLIALQPDFENESEIWSRFKKKEKPDGIET